MGWPSELEILLHFLRSFRSKTFCFDCTRVSDSALQSKGYFKEAV